MVEAFKQCCVIFCTWPGDGFSAESVFSLNTVDSISIVALFCLRVKIDPLL